MAIGVFVVDDQELLRLGVAALLEVEGDIELVGEAARAADALAGSRRRGRTSCSSTPASQTATAWPCAAPSAPSRVPPRA